MLLEEFLTSQDEWDVIKEIRYLAASRDPYSFYELNIYEAKLLLELLNNLANQIEPKKARMGRI